MQLSEMRVLLGQLEALQDPTFQRGLKCGICNALLTDDLLTRWSKINGWLRMTWINWPEYSGTPKFPVPAKFGGDPEEAYFECKDAWDKTTEYGQARWRLLAFLIEEAQKAVKAKEALEASILHWEDNLVQAEAGRPDGVGITIGECALCRRFYKGDACDGCPVRNRTGRAQCEHTPFRMVSAILGSTRSGYTYEGVQEDLTNAVREEVDFLKSLRDD